MTILYMPDRTTTSEEEYRTHLTADTSRILVDAGARVENFSIECTIGANWSERYGRTNEMIAIDPDGIVLAPGASIVVEVAEEIGVPYNMYGMIVPTGSLFLDQGIILAAAKIEPAFRGRLKLRLANISGERRTVKTGQKVASAIFFATDRTMFHPDVTKRPVTVARLAPRARRIAKWVSANRVSVIGWVVTIAGSSVMALAISLFFLGRRPPSVQQQAPAAQVRDDRAATGGANPTAPVAPPASKAGDRR